MHCWGFRALPEYWGALGCTSSCFFVLCRSCRSLSLYKGPAYCGHSCRFAQVPLCAAATQSNTTGKPEAAASPGCSCTATAPRVHVVCMLVVTIGTACAHLGARKVGTAWTTRCPIPAGSGPEPDAIIRPGLARRGDKRIQHDGRSLKRLLWPKSGHEPLSVSILFKDQVPAPGNSGF